MWTFLPNYISLHPASPFTPLFFSPLRFVSLLYLQFSAKTTSWISDFLSLPVCSVLILFVQPSRIPSLIPQDSVTGPLVPRSVVPFLAVLAQCVELAPLVFLATCMRRKENTNTDSIWLVVVSPTSFLFLLLLSFVSYVSIVDRCLAYDFHAITGQDDIDMCVDNNELMVCSSFVRFFSVIVSILVFLLYIFDPLSCTVCCLSVSVLFTYLLDQVWALQGMSRGLWYRVHARMFFRYLPAHPQIASWCGSWCDCLMLLQRCLER